MVPPCPVRDTSKKEVFLSSLVFWSPVTMKSLPRLSVSLSWWRGATMMLLMCLCLVATGCAAGQLQDENFHEEDTEFRIDEEAKIEDNETNREVLEVLLKYRQALVRKDFGELGAMISDDYYDNGSTTNTTRDDYGKEQLSEFFEMLANHSESIQYRVMVKQVQVNKSEAFIDYEYRFAYQFKVGDEESWDAGVDVNRLELKRVGEQWKIVSGL